MLRFNNIKFKRDMSELGKELEKMVIFKTNNDFTVREIETENIGELLKISAKYVFEINRIEGNSMALLFVNNDYKVKLGVSSMILSIETINRLSKIVNDFQKVVNNYVESQRKGEEKNIDICVEKINAFLKALACIFSDEGEEGNNSE